MPAGMELLEVLPGALYFLSSPTAPTAGEGVNTDEENHEQATSYRMEYIHVQKEFPYQSFYLDFGPLHLGHIFVFARKLNERLRAIGYDDVHQDRDHEDDSGNNQRDAAVLDCRVCVYSSLVAQHRANAVCLVGCWAILFKGWSAERAFEPFKHLRLPLFHDASPHADGFGLSVLHVLKGVERAVQCGFFPTEIDVFDEAAFLEDMDPDKRDLTWITPQIAAFAGPQSQPNGYSRAKPTAYLPYFASKGVTLVVRLNKPRYDEQVFAHQGIHVEDLYFPDGTCPSDGIVRRFLELYDSHSHTRIAVHCKAGLGRTGTLIACLLMQKYHFSAEEAIGWLRVCRPGSVVGSQQQFLRQLESCISKLYLLSSSSLSKQEPETNNPEDTEPASDEILPHRHITIPTTKGIAARSKSSGGASSSRPSTPTSSLRSPAALPPKIPGRRAIPTPPLSPAVAATSSSKMTQGDLLLLRKHGQTLPLGVSLWPQASSVGGD